MIFAGFVDLIILLIRGDRVAWIWVGAMVLVILPVLIVWWRVARATSWATSRRASPTCR